MKIRNLFFIGFAAVSLFAACDKKGEEVTGTPSIELSTNTLEFEQAEDSETITLTANRDWVVEVPASASSWLTVTPTSGSASDEPQTITISVKENTGINRDVKLEFNASLVSAKLSVTQKGPGGEVVTDGINNVTVSEFLSAEVNDADDAPLYRITGTLTYVRSRSYGNVYIEDETGSIYAYGLCSDESLTYQSYADIEGLTVGDKVTVVGKRGEHQGTDELVDCYYESHEDAFIEPTNIAEVSLADFNAAEVSYSLSAYYRLTGTITEIESAQSGNIYIEDESGESVYIYGLTENHELIYQSFANIKGLNVGDEITVVGCRGEHNGSAQMVNGYYESHVDGEEPEGPEIDPSEILMITEYVEGSATNKYLEIFNPTDKTITLDGKYALVLYSNGSTVPSKTFKLTGNIESGATIVYANSQATIYSGETTINNDVINFNGDDVIVLTQGGDIIDAFGTIGNEKDNKFAEDVTMRRKSSVTAPSATYNVDEWEEFGKDDVSGLGTHTID